MQLPVTSSQCQAKSSRVIWKLPEKTNYITPRRAKDYEIGSYLFLLFFRFLTPFNQWVVSCGARGGDCASKSCGSRGSSYCCDPILPIPLLAASTTHFYGPLLPAIVAHLTSANYNNPLLANIIDVIATSSYLGVWNILLLRVIAILVLTDALLLQRHYHLNWVEHMLFEYRILKPFIINLVAIIRRATYGSL